MRPTASENRVSMRLSRRAVGPPAAWLVGAVLLLIPANPCWGQDAGEAAEQPEQVLVHALQEQRQFRYWTTNWSFRDINIGTLASRLSRIGIAAPVDLAGTVSVEFAVSIPINALGDATAYRIVGTLQSPRLRIESATLSLDTGVNYQDGIVSLTNLRGAFFSSPTSTTADGGGFQGEASLRLAGEGERLARVNLAVQSLRLPVLAAAFARDSAQQVNARGTASGSLRWTAPVDSVTDATTWDAQGQLAIANLSVDGRPPLDLNTGPLEIRDGKLSVPQLQINVVNLPSAGLNAELAADFRDTQRWSARVTSERLPVESLAAVLALGAVPATQGELTLDLTAQGALSPLDWQVEGELQSPGLAVYGVRLGQLAHRLRTDSTSFELQPVADTSLQTNFRAVSADYAITPEAIDLQQIEAELFGGRIAGELHWARAESREHRANFDWSQLALRWDVGAVTSGVPAELVLSTQGRVQWQVPAAELALPAAHTLRATLQIADLTLAGASIGNAALQVRAVEGDLAVRGSGELLGGSFEVESTTEIPAGIDWSAWLQPGLGGPGLGGPGLGRQGPIGAGPPGVELVEPLPQPAPPVDAVDAARAVDAVDTAPPAADAASGRPSLSGRFRVRGLSLARAGALVQQWNGGASGRGWSGRANAIVQFDLGSAAAEGALVTRSRIGLFNFTIDRNLITPALTIDLRSAGDRLHFDSVRGNYAGGAVEVSGQWSLASAPRQVDVQFSRVDASRALLPLSSNAAQWLQGELSGYLRVTEARVLRLAGTLEGRSAELFGVPLGTVRSGVVAVISEGARGWEIRFPNVRSTVARGRLGGQATLTSSSTGHSFDLQSRWTAANVDFENLTSGLGVSRQIGRGNLSGSLLLDGRNIRSAADLSGRFEGSLAGTDAAAVPGWNVVRSYLGPIGGSALTFTSGTLRGRVLRGVALVDQLALRSDQLRVAANGSIRLDNSRMNFEAVAATGDFSAHSLVLGVVARQVATAAAPPIGVLLSINRLLSDRVVYLRIGGTPGAPAVRVRPLETIGRNALRYFLQEITLGGSTVALSVASE